MPLPRISHGSHVRTSVRSQQIKINPLPKDHRYPVHLHSAAFMPAMSRAALPNFMRAPMPESVLNRRGFANLRAVFPPTDNIIEKMVHNLDPVEKKCLEIMRTGAMSYGSISLEAHKAIAEATNRLAMAIHGVNIMSVHNLPSLAGPMSNSGEGGEIAERDNTIWQSMMRQIASGRFGVDLRYMVNARVLQIKINQGAKPGVGGELPGEKVTTSVAKARHTQPGIKLVSPPPHHDIYSIEDLKQLIYDLRSVNPDAKISVKLAAGYGIGVIAVGVAKAGADDISIAGPGGTGAAPLTAKFDFVHPWESALAEVHQTLTQEGLRGSVTLTVSGGIQTGLDHFKALALGADYVESGSSALVSLGCTMAEVCHKGTCPTGIATTNQKLIDEKFKGKPQDVARFMVYNAMNLAQYLKKHGFSEPAQVVGRTELLAVKRHASLKNLEILLEKRKNPFSAFGAIVKPTGASYLECSIITDIQQGKREFGVAAGSKILSFGARIGYFSIKDKTVQSALKDKVTIRFNGIAPGQSFGFAAPEGLILEAENSNDGTGKSLDGGEIYIKNLSGNQTCYGAIKGLFAAKHTGDRAFVRNSGAYGIVEQIGQMGANFMTGGTLAILGQFYHYPRLGHTHTKSETTLFRDDVIGPNFGAGMTGGKIILPRKLYDEVRAKGYLSKSIADREVEPLTDDDFQKLQGNLKKFKQFIASRIASTLDSAEPDVFRTELVKVEPAVYQESISVTLPDKESSIKVTTSAMAPNVVEQLSLVKDEHKLNDHAVTSDNHVVKTREKDACGTGALVRRDSKASRTLVKNCLNLITNLQHRGATGIDPKTGDGCGIAWFGLHEFFKAEFPNLQLEKGNYGVIHIGLPRVEQEQQRAIDELKKDLTKEGLTLASFRIVPTNNTYLGHIGQRTEPMLFQYVVLKPSSVTTSAFEKQLVKVRLRFEMKMQTASTYTLRPHIISASAHGVIYKALAREEHLGDYFEDFESAHFTASAAVPHSRFSTNTLPSIKNIQSLPRVANNGENNSLDLLIRHLTLDPFYRELIGASEINLDGYSDSNIMSMYMDMLYLQGFDSEEIALLTIHCYHPGDKPNHGEFYNLLSIPFEGPNASILYTEDQITIVRDKNGFRPQRGVTNNEFIYSGSELALDVTGQVFDLPPATPLVINLNTGEYHLAQFSDERKAFIKKSLERFKKIPEIAKKLPVKKLSAEKTEWLKLCAGWNQEVDAKIMQPLFHHGVGLTHSMADQGPIEALTRGSDFDLNNFFKGKFSQVTNPPLAKNEEESYLSSKVLIGKRAAIGKIHQEESEGYLLDSPLLDNHQLHYLLQHTKLKVATFDICYPLGEYEYGIARTIAQLTQDCVAAVNNGASLILLTDENVSNAKAPIPPVIVCSAIDHALMTAGVRRSVNLIIKTAYAFTGSHIAQLVSIGGVDAINPYVVFNYDKNEKISYATFIQQRESYKASIRQELLGFMARMGISTVSAYRGTKGFTAYGLDKEVADILGIQCNFGGVGFQDISRIILTNQRMPDKQGLGKYDWQGQEPRTKIWNAGFTNAVIKYSREEITDLAPYEHENQLLKQHLPRGWLKLNPPSRWTNANPMPVVILGGGASGFYQAMSLLESNIPVKITVIEQNVVNKFGLVGDGIAPDHVATKNQAKIFFQVIDDPRVQYYGGIQVGRDVTYEELVEVYPCVIDCRGAAIDKTLNVPGEDIVGVVQASKVYRIYNSEFNPFDSKNYWPFTLKSKNPILGIIGGGNVAADLARIFLKDPQELESTNINPNFLQYLRYEGPRAVRIFSRGNPAESKIGYKELEELEKLGINLWAYFDDQGIDKSNLTEHQRKMYEFFSKIKGRTPSANRKRTLYFHFQATPLSFEQIGSEVSARFTMNGCGEETFRTSNYIIAIGRKPVKTSHNDVYSAGWITGEGGSLKVAEKTTEKTTAQIQMDFYRSKFDGFKETGKPQPWMLKSSIGNAEFKSIYQWVEDRHPLKTSEDLRKARHYTRVSAVTNQPNNHAEKAMPVVSRSYTTMKDCITVVDASAAEKHIPVSSATTILQMLKGAFGNKAPKHECDGEMTCGTCVVEVVQPAMGKSISHTRKETALLRANAHDLKQPIILSCAHKTEEYAGSVIKLKI